MSMDGWKEHAEKYSYQRMEERPHISLYLLFTLLSPFCSIQNETCVLTTSFCGCNCVFVVAVLPAQGGTGPRHLESFSENFECGRRGMCAQIKERNVKEKQSKERGWRVRQIDTDIDRERAGMESVAGEVEVEGR